VGIEARLVATPRPRSMASAAATHCAAVKLTVTLMLTPRQVASSMAAMPAAVAGILRSCWARGHRSGAPARRSRPGSGTAAGRSGPRAGPAVPPAPRTRLQQAGPVMDISSTTAHARSSGVAVGRSAARRSRAPASDPGPCSRRPPRWSGWRWRRPRRTRARTPARPRAGVVPDVRGVAAHGPAEWAVRAGERDGPGHGHRHRCASCSDG
jgi:hypothetical protein